MKEVTTFNKESVYSDVKPTRKEAAFLKYRGKDGYGVWFRFIGGDNPYSIRNHPDFGVVIGFPHGEDMYELSDDEVQTLVEEDKIVL